MRKSLEVVMQTALPLFASLMGFASGAVCRDYPMLAVVMAVVGVSVATCGASLLPARQPPGNNEEVPAPYNPLAVGKRDAG